MQRTAHNSVKVVTILLHIVIQELLFAFRAPASFDYLEVSCAKGRDFVARANCSEDLGKGPAVPYKL